MAKSTKRVPTLVSVPRPKKANGAERRVTAPTAADIAARAFELYCDRGRQNGRDVEDWLQAERELSETSTSTAA